VRVAVSKRNCSRARDLRHPGGEAGNFKTCALARRHKLPPHMADRCNKTAVMPASLRDMLSVGDKPSCATGPVEPSTLLARLELFLPQMAAANAALPAASIGQCVDIVHKGTAADIDDTDDANANSSSSLEVGTGTAGADGVLNDEDGVEDGKADGEDVGESGDVHVDAAMSTAGRSPDVKSVHMDLYIDNALGELVPNEEDAGPRRPIIEELNSVPARPAPTKNA
jgi:hypothetical protein